MAAPVSRGLALPRDTVTLPHSASSPDYDPALRRACLPVRRLFTTLSALDADPQARPPQYIAPLFKVLFIPCSLPLRRCVLAACALPVLLLASCKDDDKEARGKGKPGQIKLKELDDPKDELSKEVEAFTGNHTRIVWTQARKKGASDTFAVSEDLVLMGIDTRNGLGVREILEKPGNYSRPLISTDGKTILFTDKNTVRKGGKKHYKPYIYKTDWRGTKPVRVLDGYATQCWRDPKTGVEWVYAVRNLRATKGLSLEAQRLVRFQIEDPTKEELIYDDSYITPDNIQFSRDGTRASALFPWPNAGILVLENGQWQAKKLLNGCWTAYAPDNSGLSWVFDGEHKSVTMYAGDGAKSWPLKFNDAPGVKGREMYHPRWTNHARFITLTGPYSKEKNSSGNVINKGGSTAEIYLGKLTPAADKVESWLRVTKDKQGDAYPEVWIAGAGEVALTGHQIGSGARSAATGGDWPVDHSGLLLVWRDREALNTFRDRSGQKLEARLDSQGAARFGRCNEMLLDGGSFIIEEESAAPAVAHFRDHPAATFESIVMPAAFEESGGASAAGNIPDLPTHLFRAPGMNLQLRNGRLTVSKAAGQTWKSSQPLPDKPFHLMVTRAEAGFALYVNGQPAELEFSPADQAVPASETITFGGGWQGGLLHLALHDHALPADQAAAHAASAQARISTLPAAPPRVRVKARLVETSAMPTAEGIEPYTSALVAYVYEVLEVLEGDFPATEKRLLVKHWGMLGREPVQGFPRPEGQTYELVIERQSAHSHLNGERVMDDTTAFDLEPWFDVASPRVSPAK